MLSPGSGAKSVETVASPPIKAAPKFLRRSSSNYRPAHYSWNSPGFWQKSPLVSIRLIANLISFEINKGLRIKVRKRKKPSNASCYALMKDHVNIRLSEKMKVSNIKDQPFIDTRKRRKPKNASSHVMTQKSHVRSRSTEKVISSHINKHLYIRVRKMKKLSNASYDLLQESHLDSKLATKGYL